MKNSKRVVVSLLIASFVLANFYPAAQAGVVKKLVEVSPQEREDLERERIRQQEEYKAAAERAEKERLAREAKAAELRQKEINRLSEANKPKPVVAEAPKPTGHTHDSPFCIICRVFGSVTGMAIGAPVGMIRGSIAKAKDHANDFEGFTSPLGGLVGLVTGAGTGIVNGILTGLGTGWEEPFTSQSYSLSDGDYDPYEVPGGNL